MPNLRIRDAGREYTFQIGGDAATLKETVAKGRAGQMPAFGERLGAERVRLLAAYALLGLMLFIISLVGGLAASVIVLLFALVSPQSKGAAAGVSDILVNIATFWFQLRLCALYPASIATRRIGFDVAWRTSSIGHTPTVDSVKGIPAFSAARAANVSARRAIIPAKPIGARMIGKSCFCPNNVTDVSSADTSRKTFCLSASFCKSSRLARSVVSSNAPPST